MLNWIKNEAAWRYRCALSVILWCLLALMSTSAVAQVPVSAMEIPRFDKATVVKLADSLASLYESSYVFPDTGQKIADLLRKQNSDGAYDKIESPMDLSDAFMKDIRSITPDLHLSIHFDPELQQRLEEEDLTDSTVDIQSELFLEDMRLNNFGFVKVERLGGNVGYIDLRSFGPAEFAGPTAEAAMAFLANTDAIIFDLRQNGGGNPSMIQLIMSYLFEGERLHFNSFYDRPSDSMTYWYTLPWVRGKRMPTQEVYVLTSRNTVSAAEEFTYNLKNMERATIVGETTAGAAHPVNQFGFGHAMYARISVGRAINPYTNTNWEGTGIKPHIEVPVSQALNVAHLEALKHLAEKVENPRRKARIEWAMVSLEALNNPMTLQPEMLKQYVGSFGPRKITMEDGQLFYQREDRPKMALVPLAEDLFELEAVPYFRLRFDRDPSGSIIAVTGMYDNGHTDGHAKDTTGK